MKIIQTYEPRTEELLEHLPPNYTHVGSMYVVVDEDGKKSTINPVPEVWGTSKKDAENKAFEAFIKWASDNNYELK